ncbi:hypothetical protein ACFVZH_37375 [Streptomyces sp. NPDC059534]|uniref:hypothetical protein n=1 Tax=Streptomyces sp. NPDC059534 TaxID=3346859 RepID=UPI00367559A7
MGSPRPRAERMVSRERLDHDEESELPTYDEGDIDPEMHMYDCPGTGPDGRGCETCEGWEGRSFQSIRAEIQGRSEIVPAPRWAPGRPEKPEATHRDGECERDLYEGGGCTCDALDDYDREPANMADLEDGIDASW